MITDVEPPWTKSKSDNVYCYLRNVPNEIRPYLKVEDNYVKEIGEYFYKVRVLNDNTLVFRERTGENKRISYCKICAENGFTNVPIKWQYVNGYWIPYEYDDPTMVHSHIQFDIADEDYWQK